MTTETAAPPSAAAPPPADPRTICRATPAELREFADLHGLWPNTATTEAQRRRYHELELIIDPESGGEGGAAILANALAAALEREGEGHLSDRELEVAERILSLEAKRKPLPAFPLMLNLPSGKVVNLSGFRETVESNPGILLCFASGNPIVVDEPHDVAAVRARLQRLATEINAPTLAGEDRDGDGKVNE